MMQETKKQCPNNHAMKILRKREIRYRSKTIERKELYYCPQCRKQYIATYKDSSKEEYRTKDCVIVTKIFDENYKIIEETEAKEEKPGNDLQPSSIKTTQVDCTVYIMGKHKRCKKCNGHLINETHSVIQNGKKQKVTIRCCWECGASYISYGNYINCKEYINCINANELEQLASIYKAKQNRKQELRQKKNEEKQRREKERRKEREAEDEKWKKRQEILSRNYLLLQRNQASLTTKNGSEIVNYCMCELRNCSTNETFKVTVNNATYTLNTNQSMKFYPAGTELGDMCLKAAANDLQKITVQGIMYKVVRYVRYDAVYVDSYADANLRDKSYLETKKEYSKQPEVKHTVDVTKETKAVHVYFKLNNSCMRKKHRIETVTMKGHDLANGKMVSMNVYHCLQCNTYFVNYEALQGLLKSGVYPAFTYKIINESWENLKPASQLMLYGYTVREGRLTKQQRQRLLVNIIERGLMTKPEIINNIRSKIEFNGKKAGNENAKKRWENDILFVSRYVADNSKIVKGQLVR